MTPDTRRSPGPSVRPRRARSSSPSPARCSWPTAMPPRHSTRSPMRAGFSKGAVYSNFAGKEQLCMAVLDSIHEEQIEGVVDGVLAGHRPRRPHRGVRRLGPRRVSASRAGQRSRSEFGAIARQSPYVAKELRQPPPRDPSGDRRAGPPGDAEAGLDDAVDRGPGGDDAAEPRHRPRRAAVARQHDRRRRVRRHDAHAAQESRSGRRERVDAATCIRWLAAAFTSGRDVGELLGLPRAVRAGSRASRPAPVSGSWPYSESGAGVDLGAGVRRSTSIRSQPGRCTAMPCRRCSTIRRAGRVLWNRHMATCRWTWRSTSSTPATSSCRLGLARAAGQARRSIPTVRRAAPGWSQSGT